VSFTYDPILNLGLPSDGDTSHGSALRQNFSVLAASQAPTNCYFVSPGFTDANLHSAGATAPRFFSTLQAAHDAVTTGTGWDKRAVVLVYPGQYQENLNITKSVTFVSVVPSWYRALGGLRAAELLGSATVQSPLINVLPANSTELSVGFVGFMLENKYAVTTSGNISGALIARMFPQTIYGAMRNTLAFVGCDVRAQCYGNANDWQAGIWVEGWSSLAMRDCAMSGGTYGAGANNAGVQNLIYLRGNNTDGKSCTAQVIGSRIAHAYRGVVAATPSVFNCDDYVLGHVGQSSVKAAITTGGESTVAGVTKTLGATGSNVLSGVVAGDNASYGNILGTVDLTGL